MKILLAILFLANSLFITQAQNDTITEKLITSGAWFLFSTRTDEQFSDETLTKVDFFKKGDVSSLFFDADDKLFSVFSKDGSEMWEDRWRVIDDTHFVMVSPVDESSQIMDILEFTTTKLVLQNCSEIEEGTRCVTYTYFSTKEGWLPDEEIDELNTAGVIESGK
ncbi:MAG: hypothetical protein E6772_04270 [Dysgonomonas sp.]|nr:hypothetical protein [Dysgonomonas sp.]